jgi:hypothetical protein
MSTEPESFLARWSRRKRAAEQASKPAGTAAPELPAGPPAQAASESVAPASAAASAPASGSTTTTEVPLPPIESLDGLRSDYQAFFQQPVAEELRHAALRKLFADPHFNKMDMLDVYVDDYTQFEPLPAALRVRLPSARAFLSDAERAELEAAEAKAAASERTAEPLPADAAANDPNVVAISEPEANKPAPPAGTEAVNTSAHRAVPSEPVAGDSPDHCS